MIDPTDKQTQPLPLEQPKRGRGRPATGKALSDAERARRYRANKKKRDAQPSQKKPSSSDIERLQEQLTQARARIAELEAELASRVTENDEPEAKTWRVEFLPTGKRKWVEATKGETFTTERKAQVRKANYLEKHPKISAEQLRIVCVTSRK
ncbi:hypothetical protein N1F44_14925 [Pseudomonas aeruginosa]|uniref:hypothetical protein n=1 Tax=Pseudomonas aeruginosa TaxID=287 RepID=UPI0008A9CA72|nr:hypothetical protein [Pseudomonas aeruginosa]MCM8577617.1 hypothetical protein [Pseudomonas aeruginosa]MCO3847930.1 hypothetical protein [Pseudomonas aeruginosa]MCO3973337.1 hypothetical protein [Pseudomonas aeruginosa]MCS8337854.1 hypothetical protein [Pseudomonas aeruginosa]MCS8337864.1 hypothetical protein [Pseudomonas aeruginosa]